MRKDMTIVAIIAIILVVVFIVVYYIYTANKIMNNETSQVEMLQKLFSEFISDVNLESATLTLDDSTLKNIITKEEFSTENSDLLKQIQLECDNPLINYKLSMSYISDTKVLTLKIECDHSDTSSYYCKTQSYKLKVENNQIIYELYGNGTIVQE